MQHSDLNRDHALEQLARTPLGQAATQAARNFSMQMGAGSAHDEWQMQGVIFQQCAACSAVSYPPRALCSVCWSEELQWRRNTGGARVLSKTGLYVSLNDFYRSSIGGAAPWLIGMVAHDDGPVLLVFLDELAQESGNRIALFTVPDITGEAVILGVGEGADAAQRAASIAARLVQQGEN